MMSHWKSLPQNKRNTFRGDYKSWCLAEWWDGIWHSNFDDLRKELCPQLLRDKFKNTPEIRHCLMFFLFPEKFERIVANSDKKLICRDLHSWVNSLDLYKFLGGDGLDSRVSVDKLIFQIRQALAHDHGPKIDFYLNPLQLSRVKMRLFLPHPTGK